MWRKHFSAVVTSGSLDFISSWSPQVCTQNTGQHISMGRHKCLSKESIYEEKQGEEGERWETGEILSFFFSKWDRTQHPVFAFFPFHFEQRLQQTDIIRACCTGSDTRQKNTTINCNSSAINYSTTLMLWIFCVRVLCGEVGGGSAYLIIFFCLCSKIFWQNNNCV